MPTVTLHSSGTYTTPGALATAMASMSLTEDLIVQVGAPNIETAASGTFAVSAANGFRVRFVPMSGYALATISPRWWFVSGRATMRFSGEYGIWQWGVECELDGIQLESTSQFGSAFQPKGTTRRCIIAHTHGSADVGATNNVYFQGGGAAWTMQGCLLITANSLGRMEAERDGTLDRCTMNVARWSYVTVRVIGNYLAGGISDGGGAALASGSTHNATAGASLTLSPPNSILNVVEANAFVAPTGTKDYALKSGSTLANVGAAASGFTVDWKGTTVPSGGAADIGGDELSAGSSAPVLSAPTKSDTATTATGGFTTTGTDGTARAVWIESVTEPTAPTATQILAGQNAAGTTVGVAASPVLTITSAGAKTLGAATVTSGTTRWGFAAHINAGSSPSNVLALGRVFPGTWRAASDVLVTGFTPTGAASVADTINEDTPNASNYFESSALSSSPSIVRCLLDKPRPAGTYTESFQFQTLGGTANMRVRYVNDALVSQGVTADQPINATLTTYQLPITQTGEATHVQYEFWV